MPRKNRSKYRADPAVVARRTKAKRLRMLKFGVPLVLGVGLIAFLIIWQRPPSVPGEQRFPEQGWGSAVHLSDVNQQHAGYNSNPPTSGFHVGNSQAPWGVHSEPIADELIVHNLEHGGVAISYREDLEESSVQQLRDLVAEIQRSNNCILLVPRPADQLDVPVAATAWTYLLKLQSVDTGLLRQFFEAHVGRGPESECTR